MTLFDKVLLLLPQLVVGALLVATGAVAWWQVRWPHGLGRAVAVAGVGLAAVAKSQGAAMFVAVVVLAPRLDKPVWKLVDPARVGWLWPVGWVGLAVGAVMMGLALAGERKVPATGPADAPGLRRRVGLRAVLEIGAMIAAMLGLRAFDDRMDERLAGEIGALVNGESDLRMKRAATPVPVAYADADVVESIAIGVIDGNVRAYGVDRVGDVWRWDPHVPSADAHLVASVRRGSRVALTAHHLCGIRPDDRAFCRGDVAPGIEDLWPERPVDALQASGACGDSRVWAASGEQRATWSALRDEALEAAPAMLDPSFRLVTLGFGCEACGVLPSGEVVCRAHHAADPWLLGPVPDAASPVTLASSPERACAIDAAGALRCWRIDVRAPTERTPPSAGPSANTRWNTALMLPGVHVDEVSVADDHTCARSSGTVHCWGDNSWGQLCDGTLTERGTPAEVPDLTDATAVAVGPATTCIARASGGVVCCGIQERR